MGLLPHFFVVSFMSEEQHNKQTQEGVEEERNEETPPEQVEPGRRGVFRIYLPLKKVLLHNLLGGIVWGLGTVLGAGVIFAIVAIIFNLLGGIPFIGDLINRIVEAIQEARQGTVE